MQNYRHTTSATPGAESIHADAASSDSCEAAVRKLGNLAGAEVSKATLRRQCMRIGEEIREFEREDVEPEAPSAACILPGIDGTGIPMAPSEVEGVAGKQADGTAKTREAKTIVFFAASRDPKTGEPRRDKGSGAAGVRIDSARAEGGAGRTSEFAAKELAVLSDGAAWIRNVCEEIFPGRNAAYVLDQFHALEYAAAAVQALTPDEGGRKARMEGIKQQSDDGQVARVIDGLKPHRDRDEAVAACIDCFEANKDRMPATFAGSAACRSVPASWKAPASRSSAAGSSGRGAAGRKRAPTPCSP